MPAVGWLCESGPGRCDRPSGQTHALPFFERLWILASRPSAADTMHRRQRRRYIKTSARSLTVTIVNHNHRRWIGDCLKSIVAHPYTLGPCEIVVLDNASEDESISAIRERFPTVRVLQKSIRRGFGANQNEAVSNAATDLVFLMNPDAVVHERTLDLLARAFDIDESIAIAAGPDTGSEYSLPITGPNPYPTPATALARALHLKRGRNRKLVDDHGVVRNGWVAGHALMVDRRRFVEIGGFDTSFFMYSEEVDLMGRMQDKGWKIAWIDEALTSHVGKTFESASNFGSDRPTGPIAARTAVQIARSEVRYIRKSQGRLRTVAFRAASALDAAIRYAATWVPWTRRMMVPKGPTTAHTRMYHLTRLRIFLGDKSAPDMEDHAAAWNRREAPVA